MTAVRWWLSLKPPHHIHSDCCKQFQPERYSNSTPPISSRLSRNFVTIVIALVAVSDLRSGQKTFRSLSNNTQKKQQQQRKQSVVDNCNWFTGSIVWFTKDKLCRCRVTAPITSMASEFLIIDVTTSTKQENGWTDSGRRLSYMTTSSVRLSTAVQLSTASLTNTLQPPSTSVVYRKLNKSPKILNANSSAICST